MKDVLKRAVQDDCIDYLGIAAADRLSSLPDGRRPMDLLPGAKSVVVLGTRIPQGVLLANKRAYEGARHSIYTYLWYGYGLLNLHFVDKAALRVVRALEDTGYAAYPVSAGAIEDMSIPAEQFCNREAAAAAGLGEIGYSGQLITPDVGPRLRYTCVITTSEIEPDPMYSGPALCDPQACAGTSLSGRPLCVDVCPVGALNPAAESWLAVGRREYRTAGMDKFKCMWANFGLSSGSLAIEEIEMPSRELSLADVLDGLKKLKPAQSAEMLVAKRAHYCDRCLVECPAGGTR